MNISFPRLIGGYLRLPRRVLGRERGQTIVEFAFVLPVMALLIFAAVDFSRLLLTYLAASNGARDGARQAVTHPVCNDPYGTTASSIEAKIKSNTDGAVSWARITPTVTFYNASPTPVAITTPVASGLVKVSVSTSYEPITPLAGPIIGNPRITAESQMVIDQTAGCSTSSNYTLTVTPAGTGAGTVTSSPAGISCGSTCAASFSSGTSVTLTAVATSGTFAGWSGACSGTGTCTVTMSANRAVTATFDPPVSNFTLTAAVAGTGSGTVTSSPAGISCGATCAASYTSGTSVTLTAAVTSGTFTSWSGDCTGTATTCTLSMTAAKTATATFTAACTTPPAPTGVTVAGSGPSSKNHSVSWTAAAGATAYRVEQSSDSGSSWTLVFENQTSSPYAHDIGVNSHPRWDYRITSKNACGVGSSATGFKAAH